MTIKEMIEELKKIATESENGENTIVQIHDSEWGACDITEINLWHYKKQDSVIIVGD